MGDPKPFLNMPVCPSVENENPTLEVGPLVGDPGLLRTPPTTSRAERDTRPGVEKRRGSTSIEDCVVTWGNPDEGFKRRALAVPRNAVMVELDNKKLSSPRTYRQKKIVEDHVRVVRKVDESGREGE